jgi:hypothetical protein
VSEHVTDARPSRVDEQQDERPHEPRLGPPTLEGWRRWLGKALFEAGLIVFSVLLALTLDGWREDAAQRARFAEAVHSLADEVKLNRELLALPFHLAHHRRLLAHYQSRADSGASEGSNEAFKTGLHPAPLRATAWASLSDSGVPHLMPFALRADLAGIYRDQTSLDALFHTLVAGLTAPRADRETAAYQRDQIRVLAITLTDMVATEARLLKQYGDVERKLRALIP